jgi:hypothetical protein
MDCGSRCCDVHLENNGEIKYEEYLNIKKTDQMQLEKAALELLDICLSKIEKIEAQMNDSCGIFDKFKDVASLDENLC